MPAVKRIIKKAPSTKEIYREFAIRHSPIVGPAAVALFCLIFFVGPAAGKSFKLSRSIALKKSDIATAIRSNADVKETQENLVVFRKKVEEFEKRLPKRRKTSLIIETMQQITEKAKLKFSSLDPLPLKEYELKDTNDVFIELPIKVTLKCGYYDMADFLQKIEAAPQLMKITNFNMKDDPSSDWEHSIEFVISAYSKGEPNDY